MAEEDFDANDRIAGFGLVTIKSAVLSVGLMEDRDDVQVVSDALKCPRSQALRVLDELERRGLVTKGAKRNQWRKTPLGYKLAFEWHPPRVLRPAIAYESRSGDINEQLEVVPCSIWRSTKDEEGMFEEAELDVGLHVEYETDRLIEINISQLDEYQGESAGAGVTELSVYISPADAKTFAAGLQKAIARAESESARRAAKRVRDAARAERTRANATMKNPRVVVEDSELPNAPTATGARRPLRTPEARQLHERANARAPKPVPSTGPATEPPPARTGGNAVEAALAELREVNRARLKKAAESKKKT